MENTEQGGDAGNSSAEWELQVDDWQLPLPTWAEVPADMLELRDRGLLQPYTAASSLSLLPQAAACRVLSLH